MHLSDMSRHHLTSAAAAASVEETVSKNGVENSACTTDRCHTEVKVNGEARTDASGIRRKKRQKKGIKWSRRTLIIGLTSLLILAGIIIVLLVTKIIKIEGQQDVCLTKECVQASARILKAMNLSADPCDDFASYACGGWNEHTRIPPNQNDINNFKILQQKAQIFFFEEFSSKVTENDNLMERKMKTFYTSCIYKEYIKELIGYKHESIFYVHLLATKYFPLGDMNFTRNFDELDAKMTGMLLGILTLSLSSPYFEADIFPNDGRDGKYLLTLSSRSSNLLGGKLQLHKQSLVKSRNLSKQFDFLKKLYSQYNVGATDDDIYEILKLSAQIQNFAKDNSNHDITAITLPKLMNLSSNQIDFSQYTKRIFGFDVDANLTVAISKSYFKKLGNLLELTPKRLLYNYMVTFYLITSLPYLHSEAETLSKSMYPSNKKLWEFCVDETRRLFSTAASAVFVKKNLKTRKIQTRNQLYGIADEIRGAFKYNLLKSNWLDPETQQRAIDKLQAMGIYAAFPGQLFNITLINDIYKKVAVKMTHFFINVINATFAKQLRKFSRVYKKDPLKWPHPIFTANGAYFILTNELHIYSGLLEPPFFYVNSPRYLQYGSIGLAIGHEITHGFDELGRNYGVDGSHQIWWTDNTVKAFVQKSKCFVSKYNDLKINGTLTLGENLADAGGVNAARRAYKSWKVATGVKEPILPGFLSEMSQDKLFFISAAQLYCGKARDGNKSKFLKLSHSPPNQRIRGLMMNNEDFAAAFSCAKETKMNPTEKCHVW